jgi:hypothetical protein
MRSILFLFLFLFLQNSYAQEKVFSLATVDEAPFIKECHDPNKDTKECFNQNMSDYVRSTLVTPKTVRDEGKAYVQFMISETGEIKDVQVRATEKDQKEEIIRILSSLKIKTPAKLNGKFVSMNYSMPVIFKRSVFDSYSTFFETRAKGLPLASETAYPPLFKNCTAEINKGQCFQQTTEERILKGVKNAKKGAVLNYYFEIDEDAKVKNVLVMSRNDNAARLQAMEILENLQIKAPARNQTKEVIPSYFSGTLIL